MKKITSRAEAIRHKKRSYYTGKPCKFGHISERITVDGSCRQCRNLNQAAHRKEITEQVNGSE